MNQLRLRQLVFIVSALVFALPACAQQTTRPDPTDSAHPFNTPAAVAAPATDAQFAQWRAQAAAALFLSKTMPAVAAHDFGSFTPMPGVVAHRVTYGTQFGMRVTAIVYQPDNVSGKLPAVVVVAAVDVLGVAAVAMLLFPALIPALLYHL